VIDAAEAERYGILNRVWPVDRWEDELAAFVASLASGPTKTYAAWKLAVNRSVLQELDTYTDYERHLDSLVRRTDDAREGRESFREKREARYTGR
jgi:enoyl-CoA hydratase/carnithine racemase